MKTISESQASDKTRECYEDIKICMGVAQVNLIWRRLAVMPNVLEFAWQALRPHYLNSMIPNAAWLLRESIDYPEFPPLTETELKVLDSDTKDVSLMDDVLRTYERGNAQNLIALCYLRLVLNQSSRLMETTKIPELDQKQRQNEKADQLFGVIPALPDVTSMTPEMRSLTESMSDLWVPEHYRGITPSVFRHLSFWPQWLSIIAERFQQLELSGKNALDATAIDALNQAEKHATHIGGLTLDFSPLSSEDQQWLDTALDVFIHGVLSRGVVIVPMIRRLVSSR